MATSRAARRALKAVRDRARAARYARRWGFPPPPPGRDWSGYETLLEQALRLGLAGVPGDVVEIGALFGGGTYKLCRFFARHAPDKRVITIDPFVPGLDRTVNAAGEAMSSLYLQQLQGRDQRTVFDETTADCPNLTVLAEDSATVSLPSERVALGYVDGNHAAEYVRSDFELIWSRLSPGGVVAFDDYGKDLPELTAALHERIGAHAAEIGRVWPVGYTLFVSRLG
jgi:hypothetical protein